MNKPLHPRLAALFAAAEILETAAQELAREAARRVTERRPRPKRGKTLRPGPDTPLWNTLISLVKPHLKHRGARAILARELGVHRARVGEFFDTGAGMPDAERTLRLLLLLGRAKRFSEAAERPANVRNTNIGPEGAEARARRREKPKAAGSRHGRRRRDERADVSLRREDRDATEARSVFGGYKNARRREASGADGYATRKTADRLSAQAPPAVELLLGLKAWRKVAPM